MDKFLQKYNLLKVNEEESMSLNRMITADETEAIIKKLSSYKSPRPDSFAGEFYKTFQDDLTAILHRLFQKIQEDRRLQTLHEASIILIPKLD